MTAIGYLIMQARTAHDALPLQGVQVTVLDDEQNRIYELTTDESGETRKAALETIDRRYSQDEDFAGTPYIMYNVYAQAEGFEPVYVSDIPIFAGESAVLPLVLVPMQGAQRERMQTQIVVGPPAVSQEGEREPEGAFQSGEAEQVLRQVAVPNPITVHLGTPNSAASNVQVSFSDYVKNVASSEIYPTWPEAALRANIYAIITFALNRVYTEWYRAQGYSFDITNSTAYDQAFVYGRPIYESVSRIADEIFNEYVRRQGQEAPYFTSFCNGTTTTCAGLSQWGTVSLANQGYTPIRILRYYYPDDVEIVETNIITNVLTSYPGTSLKVGSSGLDVQTVQTYLERIRVNYPAIPAITDTSGTFGESTQAAVRKFQSIFGLSADGIVGKATWYKLSSLYTAVTRLAELNSEGTNLGIGTVPPASVLRQGARGQDVITLQYLLDLIAEYYADIPAVAQDGIFGAGTKQAVTAFQGRKGLVADGVVGPATWNALYQTYQGIGQNVPQPEQTPETGGGYFDYTVKSGDTLWLLANRFGTSVDAIRRMNGLTSDSLQIGQVLRIPSEQSSAYFDYTVKAGDTLWLLANRFGTTVDAIRRLNGLSSDGLQIGQVLRIPA
ncbi:MAG: LysM peptidoglycan-binding domain-containing protein [Bacteroidales bacterium]|nr:LysM peptidoglycan-binding domain-containing protein [Bacteroidales bacterium]MCM1414833.1 LysM peptidoglycan-binding domain-containing protein [bacterium]MCM1422464.1 LysM peptidoglycan-binding domain-containing protein [bacterium]